MQKGTSSCPTAQPAPTRSNDDYLAERRGRLITSQGETTGTSCNARIKDLQALAERSPCAHAAWRGARRTSGAAATACLGGLC